MTAPELVSLPLEFYAQPTLTVAGQLLGYYLVLEGDRPKIGRIIETEAYLGIDDKGSHSSRGRTKRTETLFGAAGTVYVYLIYGIYHCFNVVTDLPETGGAVLIRAVEPILGLTGKTSGPGLLCQSYGIDRSYNGKLITDGPLTIKSEPNHQPIAPSQIECLPRVGIEYADEDKDRPYRYRIVKAANLGYDK